MGERNARGTERTMGNPIVHFEIRANDPDASRAFHGQAALAAERGRRDTLQRARVTGR
jgi:predicted enzyme related to lactoylglutathione lyase